MKPNAVFIFCLLDPEAVLKESQDALFEERAVGGAARAVPFRGEQEELVALPGSDEAVNEHP
jgi:hypothetical protein